MQRQRPVMLVGTAGTGKSVLVAAKLASLDPEEYLVKNVPFNYYTTSAMLQGKGPWVWGADVWVAALPGLELEQALSGLLHTPPQCPSFPMLLLTSPLLPSPLISALLLWHPASLSCCAPFFLLFLPDL